MFAWPFHRGFTPTLKLISHPPIFLDTAQTDFFVLFWHGLQLQDNTAIVKTSSFDKEKQLILFFSLNGFLRIQMSKTSVYLLAATDTVESPIQWDDITDVCQHAEFSEAKCSDVLLFWKLFQLFMK